MLLLVLIIVYYKGCCGVVKTLPNASSGKLLSLQGFWCKIVSVVCFFPTVFTVLGIWFISALLVVVTLKRKIKSRRKKSFVKEWDFKCTECITVLFAFRSHSCCRPSWVDPHSLCLFPRSVKCHLRDQKKFILLPLNPFSQGQLK